MKTNMKTRNNRRIFLHALTASALMPLGFSLWAAESGKLPTLSVWKDPHCGCCVDWMAHMQKHGFKVEAFDTGNDVVRKRLGLPLKYASCHTALIDGYVIEGHVPAADVLRLLQEKPDALGLAVPGMPLGSPGMDGPAYEGRHEAYDSLLVLKNGKSTVFQRHA